MTRSCLLVLCTLSVTACYSHSALLRPETGWTAKIDASYRVKVGLDEAPDPKASAKVANAQSECEVFMRISYSRAGLGRTRPHYEIVSPATCIKRVGEGFAFPGSVTLVYDPRNGALGWDAWREMGYCEDDGRDVQVARSDEDESEDVLVKALVEGATDEQVDDNSDLEVCTWNRRFRDSYPLDFEIWTADDRSPLRNEIELIQVFRNGELAFKWMSTESATAHLYLDGERLTASGLPHLSDFDLRVFPAGAQIDESVLNQEVRQRTNAFTRRLSVAATAVYEAKLWGDKSLKDKTAPLRDAIDRAQAEIAAVTGGPAPPKLGNGAAVPAAVKSQSLLERYRALKGEASEQAKEKADAILSDVSDKLDKSPEELREVLEKVRREIEQEYTTQCTSVPAAAPPPPPPPPPPTGPVFPCGLYSKLEDLQRDLEALDRMTEATLSAIDETRALASSLRQDALELGKSSDLQAALYNQTVTALAKEGDFFDPYVANPGAIGGEAILDMSYSDSTQIYVLAPWTGVAVRPSDGFRTQASATYAIPILDLIGMRVQWDQSRMTDLRLGTGIMYFEDVDSVVLQPAGEDEQLERKSDPRFALQMNVALGVFRVGAAFVPEAESNGDRNSKWRLLIGVDLYKLLTGSDLQVAATNM